MKYGGYIGTYSATGVEALVDAALRQPINVGAQLAGDNGIEPSTATAIAERAAEVKPERKGRTLVLCGIQSKQTEADFKYMSLLPADMTLIASGLRYCTS